MKQALRRIANMFVLGALCGTLGAESLPEIPRSKRVLTREEVKNYWINILQRQPIPSRPLGLHPERQAGWDRALENRRRLIGAVRTGGRDIDAELARLSHNADAWRQRGNEKEAEAAETKLRELNEYLSRMAALELQREAARAQIDSAARIQSLEAEISALRSACSSHCADH